QRAHHQILCRTFEDALYQVAGNALLHLLLGHSGLVDMRLEPFAADEQTLIGHEAHLRERSGVSAVLVEILVDFADRGGADSPENGENVDLGGSGHGSVGGHLTREYNYKSRMSTITIVDNSRLDTESQVLAEPFAFPAALDDDRQHDREAHPAADRKHTEAFQNDKEYAANHARAHRHHCLRSGCATFVIAAERVRAIAQRGEFQDRMSRLRTELIGLANARLAERDRIASRHRFDLARETTYRVCCREDLPVDHGPIFKEDGIRLAALQLKI